MPLTAVAPGVWSHPHTVRLPGGVRLPARMTILRLSDGGLWVHSPTPIDDALGAEIARLGPIRYVVAPSLSHHLHVAPLLRRFPEAKVYAAPGLSKKRADLAIAGTLGEEAAPWAGEIDQQLLEGAPRFNEVVFFHRASRSLLVTDLFFNVPTPANWMSGMVFRMMGTYRRFAPSRAWRLFGKDKKALAASVDEALEWDFVRVLPAHGDPFEAPDAREQARALTRGFFG